MPNPGGRCRTGSVVSYRGRTRGEDPRYKVEGTPMLSTLPTVDVGAWSSPVSELDLERKLAVQVPHPFLVSVIFSC
jgi:hypothetical protein